MLGEVDPRHLGVHSDPQRHDRAEHVQDAEARQRHEGNGGEHGHELHPDQAGIAGEEPISASRVHRLGGEDAREHGAHDAGHAVAGEDIERVVEARLGALMQHQEGTGGREHPDGQRRERRHEAGGWRDGHEPDDRARGGAHRGGPPALEHLEQEPGHQPGGRTGVRGDEGVGGDAIGSKR